MKKKLIMKILKITKVLCKDCKTKYVENFCCNKKLLSGVIKNFCWQKVKKKL